MSTWIFVSMNCYNSHMFWVFLCVNQLESFQEWSAVKNLIPFIYIQHITHLHPPQKNKPNQTASSSTVSASSSFHKYPTFVHTMWLKIANLLSSTLWCIAKETSFLLTIVVVTGVFFFFYPCVLHTVRLLHLCLNSGHNCLELLAW